MKTLIAEGTKDDLNEQIAGLEGGGNSVKVVSIQPNGQIHNRQRSSTSTSQHPFYVAILEIKLYYKND